MRLKWPARPAVATIAVGVLAPISLSLAADGPSQTAGLAEGQLPGGEAQLKCTVSRQGNLSKCSLVSENPTGVGLGQRALDLAKLTKVAPMTQNGRVVEAEALVPFRFRAPSTIPADPVSGSIDVASALSRPSRARMDSVYPPRASEAGFGGSAVLSCKVDLDGSIASCVVASESPRGEFFGAAALRLANDFKFPPRTEEGTVRIPLTFTPR